MKLDAIDFSSIFDDSVSCTVEEHLLMKNVARGLILYGVTDGARFLLDNLREWPDLGLLGECRRCHSTLIVLPPAREGDQPAQEAPMAPVAESAAPQGSANHQTSRVETPPGYQGAGVSRSGRRRPPRNDVSAGFDPRDRDKHDRKVAEFFAAFFARRFGVVALAAFTDNLDPSSTGLRAAVASELHAREWRVERIARALGRSCSTVSRLLDRSPA